MRGGRLRAATSRDYHALAAFETGGKSGNRRSVPLSVLAYSQKRWKGKFNDVIAQFATETLAKLTGSAVVWAVGERIHARLADDGFAVKGLFHVPNDVSGIGALVGHLQGAPKKI